MSRLPYDLCEPEVRSTSVIFASPHSGRDYPADFLSRSLLDARTIRSSEDAFVDRIYAPATDCGAPLLLARAPRAYVDLNRSAEELDPALIDGIGRTGHNPRVGSGLGVIPRVVANARPIYSGRISRAEADDRLDRIWHPYHSCLAGLVSGSVAQFGEAILLDCHSMPHDALSGLSHTGGARTEVVLGDRFGVSADDWVIGGVETAFRRAGFRVRRNAPFAGAYVTQHYGRPRRGQHAVQIEIDRSLYMDEETIRPNARFGEFSARMAGVIAEIAGLGRRGPGRMAAE